MTRNRREFLQDIAAVTGAIVLMPIVTACEDGGTPPNDTKAKMPEAKKAEAKKAEAKKPEAKKATMADVPKELPKDWDAVAFNKKRGNDGAIPKTYHASINGPDGDAKHLGKHLPYIPKLDAKVAVPAGFIAVMWGNPEKGHAKHPNAAKGPANNNEGHWYNWIKVRKAVAGEAEELQSTYVEWPGTDNKAGKDATGAYAAFGGGDISADGGKNTIYMAALPKDCKPGDTVRIYSHCLTHGEYVDFITLPKA
jgi:hypothetical protein